MLFNRYIEIVIKNFDTKEEIRVNSDSGLRIDFSYNEYLDNSSSSNTGVVKIYNLSIGTFERIGRRMKTEIEIICGYRNNQIDTVATLCIGGMTTKSRKRDGSNFITEIGFQTAIAQLQIDNKMSVSFKPKTSLMEAITTASTAMGFDILFEITQEDRDKYGEDIADRIMSINFPFGASFTGTPKQVLDQLAEMFKLTYTINARNSKEILFTIQEQGYVMILGISNSLHTGKSVGAFQDDATNEFKPRNEGKDALDSSTTALVLSTETGLVDSPFAETVEIKTAYSDSLSEGEEIIDLPPEIKRKKDGTMRKQKKPPKREIARAVVNAKSLINPRIKPNSWIILKHTLNRVDGTYRVRNIKYEASTHEDKSFIMEMNLALVKESNSDQFRTDSEIDS